MAVDSSRQQRQVHPAWGNDVQTPPNVGKRLRTHLDWRHPKHVREASACVHHHLVHPAIFGAFSDLTERTRWTECTIGLRPTPVTNTFQILSDNASTHTCCSCCVSSQSPLTRDALHRRVVRQHPPSRGAAPTYVGHPHMQPARAQVSNTTRNANEVMGTVLQTRANPTFSSSSCASYGRSPTLNRDAAF